MRRNSGVPTFGGNSADHQSCDCQGDVLTMERIIKSYPMVREGLSNLHSWARPKPKAVVNFVTLNSLLTETAKISNPKPTKPLDFGAS